MKKTADRTHRVEEGRTEEESPVDAQRVVVQGSVGNQNNGMPRAQQ